MKEILLFALPLVMVGAGLLILGLRILKTTDIPASHIKK
jgi:hypothetical protein